MGLKTLEKRYFITMVFLALLPISAEASSNPNLFVSAENPQFENYFAGSMVVEVLVIDPSYADTSSGEGEPDVTINGNSLRMVQATDGNWYAYFANADKAQEADSTVGLAGTGLDFGVFCSRDTQASVMGISLSETDGFAIPRFAQGSTDGDSALESCTGPPSGENLNNVVRNSRSINTNPNIPPGQIGLDPNAWPLVQLFSFSGVTIQYNPGGPSQRVSLEHDEIPNISMSIDRDHYPKNAEVFLTVHDFQLNQDPTDADSWTFGVGSSPLVFYQAYDDNGSDSANNGAGLVDLTGHLSSIGFEDNARLYVNLGSVLELRSNTEQPDTSVSDGNAIYSEIMTLVEDGPNSGIFDNADFKDQSTLGILNDAPRGQSGSITYNDKSVSVITGSSSAKISLSDSTLTIGDGTKPLRPGTKIPISLIDPDQNINSGSRDNLDVFGHFTSIPTLRIGEPVTLEKASDVDFFRLSTDSLTGGDSADSSVPDRNSARLAIDTSVLANHTYEKISLYMGLSASDLQSVLIDTSVPDHHGTGWLNYDFRSLANDLEISDFADTVIELSFGAVGSSPVTLAGAGSLPSSQGLIRLDDSAVQSIFSKSGPVYLVINFDSSDDSSGVLTVRDETGLQPIVLDLFSFGLKDSNDVNNAMYRFELEETSENSSTFDGTLEYSVANQINILDPAFVQTIRPIGDQVRFIVTDRSVDDDGISVSYSDLDAAGVFTQTSTKSDLNTVSGYVTANSQSFRFGQPVILTLHDPDLNLKNDLFDTYSVINDPDSPNVDTVGRDGIALFEVLIKDVRYKRCTVDGVEYGGLGASGFTLQETGPSTGIFEGSFKMPSKICNRSGTGLISPAGGSLDVRYFDSRDDLGNPSIFTLLDDRPVSPGSRLSTHDVLKPLSGDPKEIILSGKIDNPRRGTPLAVVITYPDGNTGDFASTLTGTGGYRAVITIDRDSLIGTYQIDLSYNDSHLDTLSFLVSDPVLPDWIKNSAKWWSAGTIPDNQFLDAIKYMADEGFIDGSSSSAKSLPDWIKNSAKWWANDQISDEDFVKSIQYLVKKDIIRI